MPLYKLSPSQLAFARVEFPYWFILSLFGLHVFLKVIRLFFTQR